MHYVLLNVFIYMLASSILCACNRMIAVIMVTSVKNDGHVVDSSQGWLGNDVSGQEGEYRVGAHLSTCYSMQLVYKVYGKCSSLV